MILNFKMPDFEVFVRYKRNLFYRPQKITISSNCIVLNSNGNWIPSKSLFVPEQYEIMSGVANIRLQSESDYNRALQLLRSDVTALIHADL